MYIDPERLKAKRREEGLTQPELAEKCGITDRQVQRYEKRKSRPTAVHLLCIAGVLKVSPLWLIGLAEDEKQYELRPDQLAALQAYERGDIQAYARFVRKKQRGE